MNLLNETRNTELALHVDIASTFLQRGRGLLGKKDYPTGNALWIKNCRDIHTFFMKFNIDVLFVDKTLRVLKVDRNLKPWKFSFQWSSDSVFEFKAGVLNLDCVQVGDQLHVGH